MGTKAGQEKNGLSLMTMPEDLDQAFRKFIPPFGAAGNPVDITGGEPPTTYQNTIRLGLEDGVAGAELLGLGHEGGPAGELLADLLGVAADHDEQPGGLERPRRREHVAEHGPPGDRMQSLGFVLAGLGETRVEAAIATIDDMQDRITAIYAKKSMDGARKYFRFSNEPKTLTPVWAATAGSSPCVR